MACLEVQRGRRVVERRVVEKRVKRNDYRPPYLDVFKISKGEMSNWSFLLFGYFKNQDGNKRKLFKQTNLPLFKNEFTTLVND